MCPQEPACGRTTKEEQWTGISTAFNRSRARAEPAGPQKAGRAGPSPPAGERAARDVNPYVTGIIASILVYLVIGNLMGRQVKNLEDYYVAGRQAPTLLRTHTEAQTSRLRC